MDKDIVCGFACRHTYEGEKNFDKYYIDRTVKQVVVKTGDGDEDFVIKNKVIETKRDIVQTIQADACNAGIDAYLEYYRKTGEELPQVSVSDTVVDTTKMPDNLADTIKLQKEAEAVFNNLSPELKGSSKNLGEFLASLSPTSIRDFINKEVSARFPKKEVKTDEKKEGDE